MITPYKALSIISIISLFWLNCAISIGVLRKLFGLWILALFSTKNFVVKIWLFCVANAKAVKPCSSTKSISNIFLFKNIYRISLNPFCAAKNYGWCSILYICFKSSLSVKAKIASTLPLAQAIERGVWSSLELKFGSALTSRSIFIIFTLFLNETINSAEHPSLSVIFMLRFGDLRILIRDFVCEKKVKRCKGDLELRSTKLKS